MPRTALTGQTVGLAGVTLNYQAADAANGNTFPIAGNTYLHVKNGGATSLTVTLRGNGTRFFDLTLTDPTVTVAATSDKFIGPISPTVMAQAGGVGWVDFSVGTSVTIAVING